MTGHRTRCYKLLEQKYQSEINLLQQQAMLTSQQPNLHNSRVSDVPKVSKEGSTNDDCDSFEEI
jgi:hypothetical protein